MLKVVTNEYSSLYSLEQLDIEKPHGTHQVLKLFEEYQQNSTGSDQWKQSEGHSADVFIPRLNRKVLVLNELMDY